MLYAVTKTAACIFFLLKASDELFLLKAYIFGFFGNVGETEQADIMSSYFCLSCEAVIVYILEAVAF